MVKTHHPSSAQYGNNGIGDSQTPSANCDGHNCDRNCDGHGDTDDGCPVGRHGYLLPPKKASVRPFTGIKMSSPEAGGVSKLVVSRQLTLSVLIATFEMYRYERFNVECHLDPNIGKETVKERTVTPCKESLPTSRGPHRKRFLEVQPEIRARMTNDRKTLLAEEHPSAKRNLSLVGGCADTPVDLVAGGNTDGNRPCLGNGQTVLMRTPTQVEFVECWMGWGDIFRFDLSIRRRFSTSIFNFLLHDFHFFTF